MTLLVTSCYQRAVVSSSGVAALISFFIETVVLFLLSPSIAGSQMVPRRLVWRQ